MSSPLGFQTEGQVFEARQGFFFFFFFILFFSRHTLKMALTGDETLSAEKATVSADCWIGRTSCLVQMKMYNTILCCFQLLSLPINIIEKLGIYNNV